MMCAVSIDYPLHKLIWKSDEMERSLPRWQQVKITIVCFFSVCTWSSSRLAWELGSLQPASFYCECRLVGLIVPVKSSGSLSAVYSPRLSDIDFTSILHHSFDITVFFYVTYPTSHKEYSRYMQEKLNQLWLWCSVWQLFRNAFLQDN